LDNLINAALDKKWPDLHIGMQLDTPSGRSKFTVSQLIPDQATIQTGGGNPIVIKRDAFFKALKYLVANGHVESSSHCKIRSNKDYDAAGPLCQAVRSANGTMTITYILPMLKAMGLVEIAQIDGLDSTWLT
jgi:hypothetical protein